jgi:hypothetical protein
VSKLTTLCPKTLLLDNVIKTNEIKKTFLFKIFLINTLQFVQCIFNNLFNRDFGDLTN